MPITVLTGLPGSGKSSRLIETVNQAIASRRPVATFACSESPVLANRPGLRVHRTLASRRQNLRCPLNHFVPVSKAIDILSALPAETLAAFEESHCFGLEMVPAWIKASERGLNVLITIPSANQLNLLKRYPIKEVILQVDCEECHRREGVRSFIDPEQNRSRVVCQECFRRLADAARVDLLERLQRQTPHPGEKSIYQPIDELPECADWNVVRPDSKARADIMARVIAETIVLQPNTPKPPTYLDIGCNTGYFCNRMCHLGFFVEGVDVVKRDIQAAKILDAYFRFGHTRYIHQDAFAYLEQTQDQLFDVTSAFAVFQWLMIQTTAERGMQCLEWLFAKTVHLCFLEMGYSAEPQYKEKLPIHIDREWVRRIMEERGDFYEVRMFDAKEHGLTFGRDLFVGIRRHHRSNR